MPKPVPKTATETEIDQTPGLYERPALPLDADLSYIEPELRALAIPVRDVIFDPNNANTHSDEGDMDDLVRILSGLGNLELGSLEPGNARSEEPYGCSDNGRQS